MITEERKRWKREIKRAGEILSERETVDSEGLTTEKSLEIFHIPRSASDIELLSLADESNCIFEALTAILLMTTREGEPRTGSSLYAPSWGLLLWNQEEWDARKKSKVWRIHQGLKIGCQDDLDFVIKIAFCFLKAQEAGFAKKWADKYFINYNVLKEILDDVVDLLNKNYRLAAEEKEKRNLSFKLVERVRTVIQYAWPEKLMNLIHGEENVSYYIAGKNKKGVISLQCAGDWQDRNHAIIATSTENEVIVKGYPQKLPVGSFMVQLPGQTKIEKQKYLFVDQRLPVGSWVQIKEENGRVFINPEKEDKYFRETEFIDEMLPVSIEGEWLGKQNAERAKIIEWIEKNGQVVAVINPFDNKDIRMLEKKKGDNVEVKIKELKRDPIGRGGWIVALINDDFEVPIELREMCLCPWGPGLEFIEGKTIILTVKNIDKNGLLKLSNIVHIIEDLKNIRKEILENKKSTKRSEGSFTDRIGFVFEIVEEEEKAIVGIESKNGIIHPLEVKQSNIPGGELKVLRMGEEIIIRMFSQKGKDKIPIEYLTNEEIRNIPKGWEIKKEEGKLLVPFCLEDQEFKDWPARIEVVDFIKRHSWQYCLWAKVISLKDRLSVLREMDLLEGEIQKIDYEKDGKTIKSAQVLLLDNIPGFIFGKDLGILSISKGDRMSFYIKSINSHSGFLRLTTIQGEKDRKRKQKEYISRMQAKIRKAKSTIKGIRRNIVINKQKQKTARSREWEERYGEWIADDTKKINDIKFSIQEWEKKIISAKKQIKK
jgi:hypothetical protein